MIERRREIAVGVGEGAADSGGDFSLITFALGSCVGVTLWDPCALVGGMLHCQLPVSYQNEERAKDNPFIYTDTGTAELLRRLYSLGADKRRLVARIAGCLDTKSTSPASFRVGARNLAVARRVLWKNDIVVSAEDVGGRLPRTLQLDMHSGETRVRTNGTWRTL